MHGAFIMFDCAGTDYSDTVMKASDISTGEVKLIFKREQSKIPQSDEDFTAVLPHEKFSVYGGLAAAAMWQIRPQIEESHVRINDAYVSEAALRDIFPDEPLSTFSKTPAGCLPKVIVEKFRAPS